MKKYILKRDEGSLPERLTRYRSELNDEQHRVVTAPPKATLVVAGAGTGKTRAITYRVAYFSQLSRTERAAKCFGGSKLLPATKMFIVSGAAHFIGSRT